MVVSRQLQALAKFHLWERAHGTHCIGWACHVALWRRGKVITGLRWGNLRKRDHFEDLGVDGRIIFKCVYKKGAGGDMEWSDLVQDRDRCRALVNAVMNLRVP
jgi:hypothetical protein